MTVPRTVAPTIPLILALGLLAGPAWAAEPAPPVFISGGMGLTIYPQRLAFTEQLHRGTGLGISGRVRLHVGDHFRLQAEMLQGNFGEDDGGKVQRVVIGAAPALVAPISRRFFLVFGLRLAGDHVVIDEVRATLPDGGLVLDRFDRWMFSLQPLATVGVRLGKKYRIELEATEGMSFLDGEIVLSYAVVVGFYIHIGYRDPARGPR